MIQDPTDFTRPWNKIVFRGSQTNSNSTSEFSAGTANSFILHANRDFLNLGGEHSIGETRWDEFYMLFLAQRAMKTS